MQNFRRALNFVLPRSEHSDSEKMTVTLCHGTSWQHHTDLISDSYPFILRPPCILPLCRKKHVSTLLNVRGMMRQAERQEILNVVKDFECSSALMCRDHALFSDIPITSEVHCISLGFLRLAMTVSNWFSEHRPRRRGRVSIRNATPQPAKSKEDATKLHRED